METSRRLVISDSQTISSIDEMQSLVDSWRSAGQIVALVPTMGALHAGHLSLVQTAREIADRVIVSIFVNPTQFAPGEDFDEYPRDLEGDLKELERTGGVDAVFAPATRTMYPDEEPATTVSVEELTRTLCGPFRPGHFEGVATIVARLFNICKPHKACFGLKDIQQFAIIRRMVSDLNYDVEVVGVPIVREPDGLALSSRNVYLTEEERREAVVLSMAVTRAKDLIEAGETSAPRIEDEMREIIDSARLADVQYAEVVDASTLDRKLEIKPGRSTIAAVAVHFGDTRLIDNAYIEATSE